MIQKIFQNYILPIIIAAVFGSGGFLVKSCQDFSEKKALNKEIKDKAQIIQQYTDSVKVLKAQLIISQAQTQSCKQDSAIMQGQINGIQKVDLALRNSNIRLKTELKDCEENMAKAIETGIIEVNEKKTFLEKLFKRK